MLGARRTGAPMQSPRERTSCEALVPSLPYVSPRPVPRLRGVGKRGRKEPSEIVQTHPASTETSDEFTSGRAASQPRHTPNKQVRILSPTRTRWCARQDGPPETRGETGRLLVTKRTALYMRARIRGRGEDYPRGNQLGPPLLHHRCTCCTDACDDPSGYRACQ